MRRVSFLESVESGKATVWDRKTAGKYGVISTRNQQTR